MPRCRPCGTHPSRRPSSCSWASPPCAGPRSAFWPPAAVVGSGWTDEQRTTVATLEKAADLAEQEQVRAPAVIVIGDVVAVRAELGDLRGPR